MVEVSEQSLNAILEEIKKVNANIKELNDTSHWGLASGNKWEYKKDILYDIILPAGVTKSYFSWDKCSGYIIWVGIISDNPDVELTAHTDDFKWGTSISDAYLLGWTTGYTAGLEVTKYDTVNNYYVFSYNSPTQPGDPFNQKSWITLTNTSASVANVSYFELDRILVGKKY